MAEKISIRKMRRLRSLLAKHYSVPAPPDPQETTMEDVVMAVLWEDAPASRARLAFTNLTEEFVDWNELRVSLTSEVAGVLASCGLKENKAVVLKRLLAKGIEELDSFEFERLKGLPRTKVRAWFGEIEGLPHAFMAAILYYVYQYDRVLVSEDIARVLQRLGLVKPDAQPRAIEIGLTKVAPAKEAHSLYRALHQHATGTCMRVGYDCPACVLRAECAHGKERIAEIAADKDAQRRATAKAKRAEAASKKAGKEKAASRATARKATAKKATRTKAAGKKAAAKKTTTRKTAVRKRSR
ncbi:MAG: hypothetical protein ISS72_01270 [Candidatus Brocadiae bacterium]|nr:hypothetical protein [Candidatus Brocadiia bacterium]